MTGWSGWQASTAIFLGAVGWPGVPDHVSLWGLLIPIRRGFDQYVNLRPVRLLPGVRTPLADREPRRHRLLRRAREHRGRVLLGRRPHVPGHRARVRRPAGDLHAQRHRPRDAIRLRAGEDTRPKQARDHRHQVERHHHHHALLGRALRRDGARSTRTITTDQFHIDILCAHFVQHPDWFDVVVGSNLFGDILSDLGPAVAGIDRHRAVGQHQPGAELPLDVRAGARLARPTSPASGSPTRSARSGPAP